MKTLSVAEILCVTKYQGINAADVARTLCLLTKSDLSCLMGMVMNSWNSNI